MTKLYMSDLEKHLNFFKKMYDTVRLIDPVHKQVLKCIPQPAEAAGHPCFRVWGTMQVCDNCISVRAYHDKKRYIKLEKNRDTVFLVTALPFEDAEGPVVVELIHNVTNSFMVGIKEDDNQPLFDIVQDLNAMAVQDHLTSVNNRRFLDERLPADIVQALALHQPLSVIFADINNMKKINDTYGHAAGDLALKCAAEVMQHCVQEKVDWVARYGGDEFVICLNNCGNDQAQKLAQKIRDGIDTSPMSMNQQSIRVSVSLGIQTMLETPLTAEELLQSADEDMYREKQKQK